MTIIEINQDSQKPIISAVMVRPPYSHHSTSLNKNTSQVKKSVKGLLVFFYWDFRVKISAEMTRFCLDLTYFGFSKMRFLSGISIIPQHPQKTIEMSHFPWEKSGKFQWCLRIWRSNKNFQNLRYFVSWKVYQLFWNFNRWNSFKLRVNLSGLLINSWNENQEFSVFWITKCFKLQSWYLICFEGTWSEMWSTQNLTF